MLWPFVVLALAVCWAMRQGNPLTRKGRLLSFASWYTLAFIILAADIGLAQRGLGFQIQTGLLFFALLMGCITAPLTLIYYLWKVRHA